LTNIGSTQLRFEGIDALELHFGPSTHQPRPLADESRDYLTGRCKLNPVPYQQPEGIRVDPPVARDATSGYILSRSLEANGRPVAFAFVGAPTAADGAAVRLEVPLLRRSLNYRSLANGHAYPLFYDTLFADLRRALATAAENARKANKHLWASDRSTAGLTVNDQHDLEQHGVIFPKLFRRLTEFLTEPGSITGGFVDWLATKKEQVLDLAENNFTHFDNLVELTNAQVRLKRQPEQSIHQRQDRQPRRRALARRLTVLAHSRTYGDSLAYRPWRRRRAKPARSSASKAARRASFRARNTPFHGERSTIPVRPLNARREASVRAQRLAQRGHQLTLDHVEEDAGDGVLPVEELLERVAR
jgi:endonuclease YncB( thermonuclease family)